MDPGVLCPNAVLEEIAWANPKSLGQLEKVEALRGWRLEAIGEEALAVLARARGATSAGEKPAGRTQTHKPPSKKRAPPRG
jgi:hypothetical protein